MAIFDEGLNQFRVALHGHAHTEHGEWQATLAKLTQNAPGASAGAIFV